MLVLISLYSKYLIPDKISSLWIRHIFSYFVFYMLVLGIQILSIELEYKNVKILMYIIIKKIAKHILKNAKHNKKTAKQNTEYSKTFVKNTAKHVEKLIKKHVCW